MRWLSYFIFGYLTLGAQVGLSAYVRVGGAAPNLVLIAVLFVALNAPRDAALLGAFGLGLLQDLLTQQTLGLYALSYGVIAMLIAGLQAVVNRDHPLTHILLAATASMICLVIILLHGWIHPPGRSGIHLPSRPLLYGAIYTTILAPFLLAAVQRFRWIFGFQPARRRVPFR